MENENIVNEELAPLGGLDAKDMDKYDGVRIKIARVWSEEVDDGWDKGVKLDEGVTVKAMKYFAETEPLCEDELGNPITVREKFPLKHLPNGKWQPSGHPKSKTKKFYDKLGINKFSEAEGKEILIVKKIREQGQNIGKPYLAFSI